MSWAALLALVPGLAVVVGAALALLVFRDVFDRLHFVGAASSLGALLVGTGLALDAGSTTTTVKDLFTVGVLLLTAPASTAATARAARRHRQGRWP